MLATAGGPSLAAAQPTHGFGYIPPATVGCPTNVQVQLQASSSSGGWLNGCPSVEGNVTILNGETFTVPVFDVQVMVFPSNSAVAPVYAKCPGIGPNTRVPTSPIPYEYGSSSCNFSARLPSNGPSAGAQNWQQARAVVTLSNGAQCHSEMTYVDYQGDGGSGPLIGGASSRPMVGKGNRKMLGLPAEPRRPLSGIIGNSGEGSGERKMLSVADGIEMDGRAGLIFADDLAERNGGRKMLSFDGDDDDDNDHNDNDRYDNDNDRDDNDDDNDDDDGSKRKMLSYDDNDDFDGDDNDNYRDNDNDRDDNDDDDNDSGKRKMLSADGGDVVSGSISALLI
jgi:hypothetical protein